jgi:acetylglutamate kinase
MSRDLHAGVGQTSGITVLKLGGELLEDPERLAALATVVVRLASTSRLVVVHGAGREIDAALKRLGIEKRSVDGLRVTDEATLAVVVQVLAGLVNTRFVAAVVAAGGRAVGLTGADAGIGPAIAAPPHRAVDGRLVDLGEVGQPTGVGAPALLEDLGRLGYIPLVASIGIGVDGRLLNVNADTFAARLAIRLHAHRLLVAGATPGVLDGDGRTIERLDPASIERLVAGGTAHAGMVAKLAACREALEAGVSEIIVLDGRDAANLEARRGTVIGRAEPVVR